MKRKRKTGDAGSIYEPRRLQLNAPASSPKWLAGALVATNQKCPSHQPFMSTLPCFVSCPPEPTISWTEVDFDTVCPQKPVFSWTGAAQSRRSEPFGVARAACFEQLAGVFASCGATHYAKILASLKIKNGISLTPLNCALNAFTFALNDSADALVERLSK